MGLRPADRQTAEGSSLRQFLLPGKEVKFYKAFRVFLCKLIC